MAKVVDITDKLTFEENPALEIKGKVIEVNADAPTMLKVMGLMGKDDPGVQEIMDAYQLMFPEKSRKELDKLKLSFRDLIVVVQEAVQLIAGDGDGRGGDDPYYDLFGDWDLIVASFLTQYGIRIRTKEFETVSWDEFKSLLAGLAPETPLGRIVAIRSEDDKNVIKHFTKDQKRIRDEWRTEQAAAVTPETFEKQMAELERMMAQLCG